MTERIQHVATFWMKEPGNTEHLDRLIEHAKRLADIPGVLEVRIGPRASTDWQGPDMEVDAAMILSFASLDAVRTYVPHQLHQDMIAIVGELTRKVHGYYINA